MLLHFVTLLGGKPAYRKVCSLTAERRVALTERNPERTEKRASPLGDPFRGEAGLSEGVLVNRGAKSHLFIFSPQNIKCCQVGYITSCAVKGEGLKC